MVVTIFRLHKSLSKEELGIQISMLEYIDFFLTFLHFSLIVYS